MLSRGVPLRALHLLDATCARDDNKSAIPLRALAAVVIASKNDIAANECDTEGRSLICKIVQHANESEQTKAALAAVIAAVNNDMPKPNALTVAHCDACTASDVTRIDKPTVKGLVAEEARMLCILEWKLNTPTALCFLPLQLALCKFESRDSEELWELVEQKAFRYCQAAMHGTVGTNFLPSVLATAVIFAARANTGGLLAWEETLTRVLGLRPVDMLECLLEFCKHLSPLERTWVCAGMHDCGVPVGEAMFE